MKVNAKEMKWIRAPKTVRGHRGQSRDYYRTTYRPLAENILSF